MASKKKAAAPFTVDRKRAAEWLSNTDGYGILSPEAFDGILPPDMLKRLTREQAGGEGKYAAIAPDGTVAKSLVGVSEFAAVDALAGVLGVEPCRMFMGRGKNFRTTVGLVLSELRKEGAR